MGEQNGKIVKNGARPEMTLKAILVGVVIGILFGAANAYLGLKVGLTVSASIPAAVMGVAVFGALRRMRLMGPPTILENNMVQTVGSAGESLAAGVIFTVPALMLLGFKPQVLEIFVLGAVGGVMGVLLMVPLRSYLIEKERGNLIYPEGTACASVLVAGSEGGTKGRLVFAGLGLGALFETLVSGFKLLKGTATFRVPGFANAEAGADSSTALLGVGFVLGPRIAAIMFGGGALAWLVFIPAIKLFAGDSPHPVFPAQVPISELTPHQVWHNYMRYIGAGAVAFGGVVTLIRSLPVIFQSAWAVISNLTSPKNEARREQGGKKTIRDLPGWAIGSGLIVCVLVMWLAPRSMAPGDIISAFMAALFGFFFVAVSARIVGLIGSSSNPISGMTIAALLATSIIFKLLGWTGEEGQAAALAVGAIVCISAAIAGDTSQDLKTGFLVGATPWRQQLGELVGVLTSAAVIGFVVLKLDEGVGIGSAELSAPQATLMSMVVKGVLSGDLPYSLVLIGVAAAAVVEILGIPSLPFAVGLYLPFSLTTPIMLGGAVRWSIDRSKAKSGAETPKETEDCADEEVSQSGVLFASGLIAGSAFIGMALGLVKSITITPAFEECRAAGGLVGCMLKFPAESLRSAIEAMAVGPEWAGSMADAAAVLAVLLVGAALYFVASRPGRGGSPMGLKD